MSRRAMVSIGFAVLSTLSAVSADWPRFRGPNGTGIAEGSTFPATFSEADFAWKVTLPGRGHGSPAIVGQKAFLVSAADDGGWHMLCLDSQSGKLLWDRVEKLNPFKMHQYNSFASNTPAADETGVFAILPSVEHYTLLAYNHEGKELWRQDLGPFSSQHGPGVSPMLYKDLVILAHDHVQSPGLFAFDKATGKQRWHLPRENPKASYSTPAIYTDAAGKDLVIFNAQGHGITAVSPVDGSLVWETPSTIFDKRSVSSPVFAEGLVFGTCGSGGGGNYLIAVKPPTAGKLAEVVYDIRKSAPYVPTPLVVGKLMFLVSDGGIATCTRPATGEVVWRERIDGDYFGSPIVAGDTIYVINRVGDVVAFKAADTFQPLGKSALGETSFATPAVADGAMFLRTETHLFRLNQSR